MQMNEQEQEKIYTVSRLNSEVRLTLENNFPFVWVEGEISNFAAPNSGHWYFSLKDAGAQVRSAMFRSNQRHLGFVPKDGLHVLVKARVSLYENRGEFQLIVEHMEERGEGKLRRAFELLKKKLEAAGLFDVAHKKPLPLIPKQIGVVTSPTGAAIRDILTVLKRRFPCVPVIIYPTLVQGSTAAPTIANAIQIANHRNECDVLILARGGGSLEDLWPFNEEIVANAIYKSHIPTISGVGHEVDFTIADFVADKRAATPSAAAEIATPDRAELLQVAARDHAHFMRNMRLKLIAAKQQLDWMQKHLAQQHPKRRLSERAQHLDFCELTLVQLQFRLIARLKTRTSEVDSKLQRLSPLHRIQHVQHKLNLSLQNLSNLATKQLHQKQSELNQVAGKLDALSPLATLSRGFAIVSDKHQHILRNADEVKAGDEITVRLEKGVLDCTVI